MTGIEPSFFVVGSVRVGSTLLRLLIGHHSKICACDEMEYILSGIEMDKAGKSARQYADFLACHRVFLKYQLDTPAPTNFKAMAENIVASLAAKDGRGLQGGAVHNDFAHLADVWPNAKYIFLDRDPRDVAKSVMNMGWAGTGWRAADYWLKSKENWKKLCTVVKPENRLELRFEDLIANTETELTKVCEFLGVEYEPTMVEIEGDTSYKRPNAAEASSWEKKANPRFVAEVETKIGKPAILASGYKVSDNPAISTSLFARVVLKLKDSWICTRYRISLYGFRLWLDSVLARRTGFSSWQNSVQIRMNAINVTRLK
ncbi:sulfotransferase [Halioxenophilus sp. WMMB6]|uniref:sulfotransferase family protein n=1 Tax=Halioxenophilus sp. WMMB6 TaxID=3073815 RepID=UPI00295F1947|nr:sulfotransferase [Halioxenophilus sp. WMMB6]